MSKYSEQATATEVPSANKNQHIKTEKDWNERDQSIENHAVANPGQYHLENREINVL